MRKRIVRTLGLVGSLLGIFALSSCASGIHRPPPEMPPPAEDGPPAGGGNGMARGAALRESMRSPDAPAPSTSELLAASPDAPLRPAADLAIDARVDARVDAPLDARPAVLAAGGGDPLVELVRPAARRTFGSFHGRLPQEEPPPAEPPPQEVPHFEELSDRWSIEPPPYEINKGKSPWDPYNQNRLKGDYPVIGDDVFLALEGTSFTIAEGRNVPTRSGIVANNEDFFGNGDQFQLNTYGLVTADLFKGQQAFKPVDWRLRLTAAVNLTYLAVSEPGAVNINPNDGEDRTTGDLSLEEAFVEIHLLDLNERYDFISSEVGILQFRSDFRGFIFDEVQLGARVFGTADDAKWQYNLAFFHMLEKDTNSLLNTFVERDQQVLIANVYRFDFPIKGWNQTLSFHWNHDQDSTKFDDNDFLVRPAPVGAFTPSELDAYYLGWATEGHIGRVNVVGAFYQVWGSESHNPFAANDTSIDAQLAALELSIDFDWWRLRGYGLYASGDDDTRDGRAEGFDAIVDAPNFAGGEFSFWNRQGIQLLGVKLTQAQSPLADFSTSKFEGQANFVNPGVLILGMAADFELTPTLRASAGVNYLRFVETQPIEIFLELEEVDEEIGIEAFLGVQYRPLLTNNVILTFGTAFLKPGDGLERIYESDTVLWHVFTEITLTW